MKLYAFATPDVPKHTGFLRIGETYGDIEDRIKHEGHELNVKKEIVWTDAVITDRTRIDKMIHRYLVAQGFPIQQFDETGQDTEWVKCTVDDLVKAFVAVKEQIYQAEIQRQALCDKFYEEIRNWYYWTTEHNPNIDSDTALRLVVRLLFCCFLQEKELMPRELFDEHFVREHFKEDEEYRYYNAVLRNIFFHCLNTAIPERKNLEYKKLIKNIRPVKEQFDKIPFLNGGIFNQHEGDEVPLSNDFFFSELQTRRIRELGGNYKVAGLVRILMQYHYKLSLDDLLDREYAETVDPEFIGKVFESLLACIEAESQVSRRKITGSFYTPNEVVDYMVCEALDMYIESRELCSRTAETQSPALEYLLQCRILDPSCGSGAFPCGIMNEIMRRLDSHRTLPQWERYRKKLEILQKVIYGVDIQPMAVQISQLRLFLSLIQEIVPEKRKPNYGIQPLPNLETKFVCADTLLALKKEDHKGQRTLELRIVRETVKQLAETRSQYFMASGVLEKECLRRYDESLRATLGLAMEESGELAHDTAEKLAQWDPYNASRSVPFFDSVWIFGIEKFDIIIGNPPYVEAKKLKTRAINLRNDYKVFSGTADLSAYFIERSLNLCKPGGLLYLITTNKFFNTEYGKLVRSFILKHQICLVFNFEQVAVFARSLVSSVILGIKNEPAVKDDFKYKKVYRLNREQFQKMIPLSKTKFGTYQQSLLTEEEWSFADTVQLALKTKIESANGRLSEIEGIKVFRGITTGYNPAFIIDENKKNELLAADGRNAALIKPLLQGRNIRRWTSNESGFSILTTGFDIDIKTKYRSLFKHLNQYRKALKKRDDQGQNWWNLRACTYYNEFEKSEKIIWGLTADKWAFAYDDGGHYLPSNAYMLTSTEVPIKYILGLLNSKLLQYYFSFIGVMTAGGAYTLKYSTIQHLPIVIAKDTKPLIALVDKILAVKQANFQSDTTSLERKIDDLVYELYGLTKKEIAVIEKIG